LRPGAAENGLYFLILAFVESVKNILRNYGPPPSEYDNSFREWRDPQISEYEFISFRPKRMATLTKDADLAFVLSSFGGDLFQGLHMIVGVIQDELNATITQGRTESEMLYATYLITTFVLFYFGLFKRTLIFISSEVRKARDFVLALPTHTMTREEVADSMGFFQAIVEDDDKEDKEDEIIGN